MVLTGLNLEHDSGMAVLDQLLDRRPDLPVVIVTGLSDFELAMAAIQRGACDYLVKAGDYLFCAADRGGKEPGGTSHPAGKSSAASGTDQNA
ncbi:MAG: response regulator [Rhodospirillales bacterium]|nr:response regulator [Rhodospirillales bacterium]